MVKGLGLAPIGLILIVYYPIGLGLRLLPNTKTVMSPNSFIKSMNFG